MKDRLELELAYYLIRGFVFARRFIEASCERHQSSLLEYMVLVTTAGCGESGLGQSELLHVTGMSRARLRAVLDEMVAKQLIEREADDVDRRAVKVRVLSKGLQLKDDIDKEVESRMRMVTMSMSNTHKRDLCERLQSLSEIDLATRSGLL